MKPKSLYLRNDPLWKEVYALADYMYKKHEELIDNFPDEKWATGGKLHDSANDSMFYVSQAIGVSVPGASEYEWSHARKSLFALQSMYIFACKQKFLELEPSTVVRIDKLIQEIDERIVITKKEIKERSDADLEPWLEKYRLWKEISKE